MDLVQLLRPLESGHGSCGEDLIFSAEFDTIQEARRFEDPSLSQGEWVTSIKEADWLKVILVCESLLANQSKDLRLAAWLTEARGKVDGLAGLAEGYTLLGQLCERFWNDIHPLPDDGDLEQRVGVLDWLVNQTSRLIRETALTQAAKGNFSSIDLESARAFAKNIERNPGMAEELSRSGNISMESFEAALKGTPARYFIQEMGNAERLKNSMQVLETILDPRMGEHAPAFGPTFDVLDDVFRFFKRNAGDSGTEAISGKLVNTSSATERIEPSVGAVQDMTSGKLSSREQAIRQLQEVAEFFRRTEPHSPVAYLAEKAAKWGAMSLHEWLRAVVKDGTSLSSMEELLGVDAQPPEAQG